MTHLDKLVAHTVWANGEWITFAAKNFPADDFVLVRLSHILLGERAWFDRITGKEPEQRSFCSS